MKKTITSTTPNIDYMDHMEDMVRRAFRLGIVLGMVPGAFLFWLISGLVRHW